MGLFGKVKKIVGKGITGVKIPGTSIRVGVLSSMGVATKQRPSKAVRKFTRGRISPVVSRVRRSIRRKVARPKVGGLKRTPTKPRGVTGRKPRNAGRRSRSTLRSRR